jgi:hypothetical protein
VIGGRKTQNGALTEVSQEISVTNRENSVLFGKTVTKTNPALRDMPREKAAISSAGTWRLVMCGVRRLPRVSRRTNGWSRRNCPRARPDLN